MTHGRSSSFSEQLMPPSGANAAYYFMDKARQKYKTNPQLVEPVRLPAKIPTPEELEFDESLDRLLAQSNLILQEATEQLEKPCVAPAELTPSEKAEKENAEAWTRGYEVADRTNDQWLKHNEQHFEEFMETMDELEVQNAKLAAQVSIPAEEKLPGIDGLPVRAQTKHWLKGSWEFREFSNRDFAAAQRAQQHSLQRQPSTGHLRASSEPPTSFMPGTAEFSIWKGAEALGGKVTRSGLSIKHRVTSSVGGMGWQNIFKVDKTVKW